MTPKPDTDAARVHPVSMRGAWARGPIAARQITVARLVAWLHIALVASPPKNFTDF